jgi:hypothetical protein
MIYILGIIIVVFGLIQIFKVKKNSRQEKLDATIVNIGDYAMGPKNKVKQVEVTYIHNSKNYKSNLLLKDNTKQIGEVIQVTYKEEADLIDMPLTIEMYSPKSDLKKAYVMIAIGISIVALSQLIIFYFNL